MSFIVWKRRSVPGIICPRGNSHFDSISGSIVQGLSSGTESLTDIWALVLVRYGKEACYSFDLNEKQKL